MKKFVSVLVIGILLGGSSSFIVNNLLQKQPQPLQPLPPTLEKIEQVAKLITIEYYMADVVSYQNNQIWPFSDQKILVIAKAKIMAGFNLVHGINVTIKESEVKQSSVKPQVSITLPPPQILSIQPDYRYYDIQGNPPPEAHTYVLNLAKVNLSGAALREGILEKAKISVIKQMQQIFSDVDLEIHFQSEPQEVKNENN